MTTTAQQPLSRTALIALIREHAQKLVQGYDQTSAEWFASLSERSYAGVLKAFTHSINHLEEGTLEWKESVNLAAILSGSISIFARRIGFENVRYWQRPIDEDEQRKALDDMQKAAVDLLQKLPK
jgi:hypothetical protein